MVAVYERNRALEIESRSIVTNSPEYKAIAEQNWVILQRNLQVQYAISQLPEGQSLEKTAIGTGIVPIATRRELANIRNSQLKLEREKTETKEHESRHCSKTC